MRGKGRKKAGSSSKIPPPTLGITWNNYSKKVHSSLGDLLRDKHYCDVDIVCQNNEALACHKFVLAAFSPIFREHFANGNSDINLSGVDSEDMGNLLEYMYKGRMDLSEEATDKILNLAKMLKVTGLHNEHDDPENGILLVNQWTDPEAKGGGNFTQRLKITPSNIKMEDDQDLDRVIWHLEGLEEWMRPPSESQVATQPKPVSLEEDFKGITQNEDSSWTCLECGTRFTTKSNANRHLQNTHRKEKQVPGKCHICTDSKVFPNLTYLRAHLARAHNLKSHRGKKKS